MPMNDAPQVPTLPLLQGWVATQSIIFFVVDLLALAEGLPLAPGDAGAAHVDR